MRIFEQIPEINLLKLLKSALHKSLENMITSFQNDCIQYKPHINYMSLNPLAKLSLSTLITKINRLCCTTSTDHPPSSDKRNIPVFYVARAVVVLLRTIQNLESMCLTYVDLKHVEKFVRENLLKQEYVESFIDFVGVCCKCCGEGVTILEKQMYLECIDCILREKWIWLRLNETENYRIVKFVFDEFQKLRLFNTNSCQRWIKEIGEIYNVDDGCKLRKTQSRRDVHDDDAAAEIEELSSTTDNNKLRDEEPEIDDEKMALNEEKRVKQRIREASYKKAVFIGKLIEAQIDMAYEFELESVRKSDSLIFFVSIALIFCE